LLTSEVRSALVEGLETRQRLKEADATLMAPMTATATAVQLRKPELLYAVRELELPERRRRTVIPLIHVPTTEVQKLEFPFPGTDTPNIPARTPQYKTPLLTTTTTPTTSEVVTPTYTPITVPKISEVPTLDVPTVPTYDTYPMPQPEPLPSGWWRRLPPSLFTEDSKEGAYRVQAGKRQILVLA